MAEPGITAVKTLFALSCNSCAHPGCEERLTDPAWRQVNADIAHICGDRPGSARYDETMTDADRQAFENLLLLCPNHHRLVDRLAPEEYPVDRLRSIKHRHEERCAGDWATDPELENAAILLLTAGRTSPSQPRLVVQRTSSDAIEVTNVGEADALNVRLEPDPLAIAAVVLAPIAPGSVAPGASWTAGHVADTFSDPGPHVLTARWSDDEGKEYSAEFRL